MIGRLRACLPGGRRASGTGSVETRSKGLLGFGILHAFNTALNMGFTLLQLVVLARILPFERYSEVVFLATIGFYVQPIDQAIGKSHFVALQVVDGTPRRERPELPIVLAAQAALLLVIAFVIPSFVNHAGSLSWVEDVLFLFLCLSINFWAFDLQSTAWAVQRNLSFVKLSIVHRACHFGALAIAFATGSFTLFVALASLATFLCLLVVAWMFVGAGFFAGRRPSADWRGYLGIFRLSLLATLTDFLVLNAPYALVAAKFGIGPALVIFDSVMKVARIVMAGSRTLAEIALTRHGNLVAGHRMREARGLFRVIVGLSLAATLVPVGAILAVGHVVFHSLLGHNDVVPDAAMPAAALIVLASGLYQPTAFFLSFSNRRGAIRRLTAVTVVVIAVFSALLYILPIGPVMLLALFGTGFLGIGCAAAWLADRLYLVPKPARVATALNDPLLLDEGA